MQTFVTDKCVHMWVCVHNCHTIIADSINNYFINYYVVSGEWLSWFSGIKEFWRKVDIQKCRKYIGHLRKVIPKVIEVQGAASGY